MSPLYSTLLQNDQDGELRLLNIKFGHAKEVLYELTTHWRSSAPEYDAVSWSWGEDPATTTITCNGHPLTIRTNLYEALPYLNQSRPLWIDAICLNQQCTAEKNVQVPLMNKIYANAARTLVWLGPAATHSDVAMEQLRSLTRKLVDLQEAGNFKYNVTMQNSLPNYGLYHFEHPIWEGMREVFSRTWFGRLWTVQEIVLSKAPILLCGSRLADWEDLALLNRAAMALHLGSLLFSNSDSKSLLEGPSAFVNQIHLMRQTEKGFAALDITPELRAHLPTGIDLPSAVRLSIGRVCGLKVDRIWALLGLLNPKFRDVIRNTDLVKYSDYALENYHESYFGVMKEQIKHDPYLAMQLLADGLGRAKNPALPSWCPDWAEGRIRVPVTDMVGVAAGRPDGLSAGAADIKSDRTIFQPVMTYKDDDPTALNILGLRLDDTVQNVSLDVGKFWSEYFDDDRKAYHQDRLSQALVWASDCHEIIENKTDVHARKTEADTGREMLLAPLEHTGCAQLLTVLDSLEREIAFKLFPKNEDHPRVLIYLWCNGRKFFRTRKGKFGLGPPDIQPGDVPCAFFGSTPLFLLRSVNQQGAEAQEHAPDNLPREEEFCIVGDAYIPELMNGEIFQSRSCEDMRNFRLI